MQCGDGQAAAEHVDHFHRQVEVGGGSVETDAKVSRGQESRVVSSLKPQRHHLHLQVNKHRDIVVGECA